MKVSEIRRAAEMVSRFEGKAVLVLPGNHDYITPESALWERFRVEAGEKILVLDRKEPVDLSDYGLDAVVYPAPCHAKHSAENAVGWVRHAGKPSDKMLIGIRSEEHTSELQSRGHLVCRLLLEKKKE